MANKSDPTHRPPRITETLRKILEQSEKNAAEISALRAEISDVRDLLEAWRNARGLIRTIHTLGRVAMWCTAAAAPFVAGYYFLMTQGGK